MQRLGRENRVPDGPRLQAGGSPSSLDLRPRGGNRVPPRAPTPGPLGAGVQIARPERAERS